MRSLFLKVVALISATAVAAGCAQASTETWTVMTTSTNSTNRQCPFYILNSMGSKDLGSFLVVQVESNDSWDDSEIISHSYYGGDHLKAGGGDYGVTNMSTGKSYRMKVLYFTEDPTEATTHLKEFAKC